jgi:hypothetical protein
LFILALPRSVCPDKGVVHPFPPSSQTLFRTYHHDLGTRCPCPPLPRPWQTHNDEFWGWWRTDCPGGGLVRQDKLPSPQPMHHRLRAIASEDQRENMSHVLPLLCGSNRSGACGHRTTSTGAGGANKACGRWSSLCAIVACPPWLPSRRSRRFRSRWSHPEDVPSVRTPMKLPRTSRELSSDT